MKKSNKEIVKEQNKEFLESNGGYLDLDGLFINGDIVAEKFGVTEKTLITLSTSGEFDLGRIAGKMVITKKTLLSYLDRNHFKGSDSETDTKVTDSKGRVKKELTFVNEPHTEVPELKPVHEFAIRIGLDDRTFIRHCDVGTFYHYRIGSLYKMSEQDWVRSLKKSAETGQKSNRGAGRPNKVQEKLREIAQNN